MTLLDALPDPVILIDDHARLLWGNATAERAFGWSKDEMVGQTVDHLVHPDDLGTAMASLLSVQRKLLGSTVELRLRNRAGTYRSYEVRGRNLSEQPAVGGIVLSMRDLTDRGRWEVAHGDEVLTRAVLDHAPGITMLLDSFGRLRGASRALTTILGRDLETTLGHHLRELVVHADAMTVEAELALAVSEPGTRAFEVLFTTKDDSTTVPMSITVVNLLDDRIIEGLVVTAVDVTRLAEARERLQHLANHDQLTGLPNRGALTERLEDALLAAERRGATVSLLYCDVDRFKGVNDRHGHLAGDHVLREIADRLLTATRSGDTVARMGGDEFVVLVADGTPRGIDALVRRIQAALEAPIALPTGGEVNVGITTGWAAARGDSDVDDLLGRADAAMYDAKRSKQSAQ
jgi:diguanylate cyclase (GGDEF)-like protein/PAS domain S-box-containing protein